MNAPVAARLTRTLPSSALQVRERAKGLPSTYRLRYDTIVPPPTRYSLKFNFFTAPPNLTSARLWLGYVDPTEWYGIWDILMLGW